MSSLFSFLLFFSFLSTGYLNSLIIECDSFCKISNFAKEGTLVLLDIDDTLIHPSQMLGSDPWFTLQKNRYITQGLSPQQAFEKIRGEWYAIQHLTSVQLVEPDTSEQIQRLQQSGVDVIGLTTRGFSLALCTVQQLNGLNIDLNQASPFKQDVFFENDLSAVLFYKGILFTGSSDKGNALFKLLDPMNYSPKSIVFINDKDSHLREVEKVCEKYEIPFLGLRYNQSDRRSEKYVQEIADIQYAHFTPLLSDEEALLLLNKAK